MGEPAGGHLVKGSAMKSTGGADAEAGRSKRLESMAGLGFAEQRRLTAPGGANQGAEEVGAEVRTGSTRAGEKGRPEGRFHVLGQAFATLGEVHDWLQAERPQDPVVEVRLTPKSVIHVSAQTTWHYYNPNQRIVLDGQGAIVTGLVASRPSLGYFLSYRPAVGAGTTADRPAAANIEVRNVSIRGFESGGIEISPVTAPGAEHAWGGGIEAFVAGAHIHDTELKGLGSKRTAPGQAVWNQMRFGAAGIMMRGVQGSVIEDNRFDHLENGRVSGSNNGPGLIHAVYINNASSGNVIRNNRFTNVSGDAIRVSNGSNKNRIVGNESKNAGKKALVNHWYNVGDPEHPQLPSKGTVIRKNEVGSLYGSETQAKLLHEQKSHGKRPDLA